MDVKKIKQQALEISKKNYRILIPSFYLINCVSLIVQSSSSGVITLAAELLLVTLAHGFIYMSLILVHEQRKDFSFKEIFIGLFQFAKYFPSYITRKVIILIPTLIMFVPSLLKVSELNNISFYTVADQFIYLLLSKTLRFDFFEYIKNINISFTMVLFIVLGIFVGLYLSIMFVLVPCIVEDYDYAWNEALIKSARMMHGHIYDFTKLMILLLPQYFYYMLSSVFLINICMIIPYIGLALYLVLSLLSIIVFWQIPFYQAIAFFYLNIRSEEMSRHPLELFKI